MSGMGMEITAVAFGPTLEVLGEMPETFASNHLAAFAFANSLLERTKADRVTIYRACDMEPVFTETYAGVVVWHHAADINDGVSDDDRD